MPNNPNAGSNPRHGNQPKKEWERLEDYEDQDTGLILRVNRLPLARPKYSIQFGMLTDEGTVRQHVNVQVSDESGGFEMEEIQRIFNHLMESAKIDIARNYEESLANSRRKS